MSHQKEDSCSGNKEMKSLVGDIIMSVNGDSAEETIKDNVEKLEENVDDSYEWSKICRNSGHRINTGIDRMNTIAEHIPNTTDAYLDLYCGKDADYDCVQEAVSEELEGRELTNVLRIEQTTYEKTDLLYVDEAGGQPPKSAELFAELGDEDRTKSHVSYFHGERSKGHLTCLHHIKPDGYKIVVTSTPYNDTWTVILFKWHDEREEFVYLSDNNGNCPSFTGDLDCGGDIGRISHGTASKIIGFDMEYTKDRRSWSRFVRELSNSVVNSYIPLKIVDEVNDESLIYKSKRQLIENNKELFEFVDTRTTDSIQNVPDSLLPLKVTVVLPKDNLPVEQKSKLHKIVAQSTSKSVLICADGHTHYRMTSSFVGSKLGLNEIQNDVLVIAELQDLETTSEIFNDNRNGLSDKRKYKSSLTSCLVNAMNDMDELEKINGDRAIMPDQVTCEVDGDCSHSQINFRMSELPDNPDLLDFFDDKVSESHQERLRELSTREVAPNVYKCLDEHPNIDILPNLPELIKFCEPYTERSAVERGKEVSQSGKQSVGTIHEVLVYIQFVKKLDNMRYECYMNPNINDLPSIQTTESYNLNPDTDIVVYDKEENIIYVFSLKTSFKDRIKQSAFWKLGMALPELDAIEKVLEIVPDRLSGKFERLFSHSPFEKKDVRIRYGYISPIISGNANSKTLDEFDMGYVPSSDVEDERKSQESLESLSKKLEHSKPLHIDN